MSMVRFCEGAAPRPRDGPWAWLVCFSAATCNFLHFGLTQSFGVFMPVLSDYFGENREKTAWAGSVAIALTFLVGPLAVKLSERFGQRLVAMCSGLVCVISLITSSFVTDNIVYLYFSYGVLFGAGAGCILNTGYVMATKYFTTKKRSLATGIVASGASIGIMVLGPTLQALLDAVGWRNTLRVMAGAMFLICILGAVYDPNIEIDQSNNVDNNAKPEAASKKWWTTIVDCSVWKNITYTIGTISIVLTYFALFVPNLHIVRFAKDLHISSSKASQLFIYIGVFSTLARIISGQILDKRWLTPLHSVQLSSLMIAATIIMWALSKNYTHFVVFAVFYGISNGSFVTSQAVFFQSTVEPHQSATGLGLGYMASSVAILGGAPVAGFIADQLGSYIPSFYAIGSVAVFAALFPFTLRLLKCGAHDEHTFKQLPLAEINEELDTSDRPAGTIQVFETGV